MPYSILSILAISMVKNIRRMLTTPSWSWVELGCTVIIMTASFFVEMLKQLTTSMK